MFFREKNVKGFFADEQPFHPTMEDFTCTGLRNRGVMFKNPVMALTGHPLLFLFSFISDSSDKVI
jgi:hypothetical protein